MVDGLLGLRHHAVVGRNHQNDHVGGSGATGTHRRESGVPRRVDEGDVAVLRVHVIGTDVLGDAPGLAGHHAGVADMIEKRGLAVVDVSHDRDHRCPWLALALDLQRLPKVLLHLVLGHDLGLVAEFLDQQDRGVLVERLVDRGHDAHAHQGLDRLAGLNAHPLRQFANRHHAAYFHFAGNELLGFLELAALFLDR